MFVLRVISETSFLMSSNDVLCPGFQLFGLSFSVFFNSGLNAAAVCAKFGIHLVRWCIEPMKLFSCLKILEGRVFQLPLFFYQNCNKKFSLDSYVYFLSLQKPTRLSKDTARNPLSFR